MCYDHFWLSFPETTGFRGLSGTPGGERGVLAWPGLACCSQAVPSRWGGTVWDRLRIDPKGRGSAGDADCPSGLVCSCITFMKPGAS